MIPDSARERAVAVFALLTVAIACTWPSWALLVHTWRVTADYEHGFALALLIAVWIFIRSGDLPASAKWLSLAPAALLLVLLLEWLVAYRAASAIGQQVVLPLILCSAVWMAFGRPVAARFASPILCLYFAIPIWDLLVPVLQKMTVFV